MPDSLPTSDYQLGGAAGQWVKGKSLQYMVPDPGDVILTGTPEGVALCGRFPYLRAGDVLELEAEELDRQRQVVR